MFTMQIEILVQRGTTVVSDGKTSVAGYGAHPIMERLPAACLSVLRPSSRLAPQVGNTPELRRLSTEQSVDTFAALRAGRPWSRVLASRGSAIRVGWAVHYGWSLRAGETWLTDAKPSAAAAYRGSPPVSGLLKRQPRPHCRTSASVNRPGMGAAQFGPVAGAFTASLRGKRAG